MPFEWSVNPDCLILPQLIIDTIGCPHSQCDWTPTHCPVATLFSSVPFTKFHRCVAELASHFAVRSQLSPLPGAGVSWPAASRHSPLGVTTEPPTAPSFAFTAGSFHPEELLVDGHEAAQSADM